MSVTVTRTPLTVTSTGNGTGSGLSSSGIVTRSLTETGAEKSDFFSLKRSDFFFDQFPRPEITVTPISRPLVKGREYFFGGASRQFCHWLLQAAVFEPRPFLRFMAANERRIAPDTHQDQARVKRWPAPWRRCRPRRTLVARRIQSNLTVPWLPACRRQSPDGLRCVRSAFTAAGDGDPASNSVQLAATPVTVPRACSVSAETDHALDSLFGRIFYGKPVSTFPENARVSRAAPASWCNSDIRQPAHSGLIPAAATTLPHFS